VLAQRRVQEEVLHVHHHQRRERRGNGDERVLGPERRPDRVRRRGAAGEIVRPGLARVVPPVALGAERHVWGHGLRCGLGLQLGFRRRAER